MTPSLGDYQEHFPQWDELPELKFVIDDELLDTCIKSRRTTMHPCKTYVRIRVLSYPRNLKVSDSVLNFASYAHLISDPDIDWTLFFIDVI